MQRSGPHPCQGVGNSAHTGMLGSEGERSSACSTTNLGLGYFFAALQALQASSPPEDSSAVEKSVMFTSCCYFTLCVCACVKISVYHSENICDVELELSKRFGFYNCCLLIHS